MSGRVEDAIRWLEAAPPGTTVTASWALELLRETGAGVVPAAIRTEVDQNESWRTKFWRVPDDTRLDVRELAEALGKPASWIYRRTSSKSEYSPLPHHRLDHALIFVVGEIKRYLTAREEIVIEPPTSITPVTRRSRRHAG